MPCESSARSANRVASFMGIASASAYVTSPLTHGRGVCNRMCPMCCSISMASSLSFFRSGKGDALEEVV